MSEKCNINSINQQYLNYGCNLSNGSIFGIIICGIISSKRKQLCYLFGRIKYRTFKQMKNYIKLISLKYFRYIFLGNQ